jgi:hypothetical protein
LDQAIARLQQHRDAIQDGSGDSGDAPGEEPAPAKKGRRKKSG